MGDPCCSVCLLPSIDFQSAISSPNCGHQQGEMRLPAKLFRSNYVNIHTTPRRVRHTDLAQRADRRAGTEVLLRRGARGAPGGRGPAVALSWEGGPGVRGWVAAFFLSIFMLNLIFFLFLPF